MSVSQNENVYQVITDAGFDGGIDDKLEYVSLEEAKKAGEQYLSEGYEGYAVFNQTTKKIEVIAGDFSVEAAFNENILKLNGLYNAANEDRINEENELSPIMDLS